MPMTDYKNLQTWQKSIELVTEIYRVTRPFPKDELFGLSSQMRRAAVSVPSNIAEGKGRHSIKELIQFPYKARGSLLELETQILIAQKLKYVDSTEGKQLNVRTLEIVRMLNGMIRAFQQKLAATSM